MCQCNLYFLLNKTCFRRADSLGKYLSIPVPYNVATLKNATQSAIRNGGEAKYGVDGFGAILVDSLNSKRVETGPDPDTGETWWGVDLGGFFNISHIILTTAEGIPVSYTHLRAHET